MTTLLSAVDEIDSRKQLTDEEFAALKERVKEQGAIVKESKEVRAQRSLAALRLFCNALWTSYRLSALFASI